MDKDEEKEQSLGGKQSQIVSKLTLEKAIELGEYDPNFLANFPEWHALSKHIQFQYIRTALDNRRRQLLTQYAELNNVLDLRNKPDVWKAIKNVDAQLHHLLEEKERLYLEYSK